MYLEEELAQCKARLGYYERHRTDSDFVRHFSEPPELAPMKMSEHAGTFYLAGLSDVTMGRDGLHFMARTYSDKDEDTLGIAYFINQRTLDQAPDPQQILAWTLEQLFHELKRYYFDSDKPQAASDCSDPVV